MPDESQPSAGAASITSLTAYILPSTRTRTLLRTLIVADGGEQLAHRPLPYGAPLPDAADQELQGLGYQRLDDWTPSGDWWRCSVEPAT
ncbi:hypothetical protein [Jiangella alkaliphila]|uniref:Uncharacterized protein n=1 Tax=Jiangella alkaliphila TaxID=419479 RepID=A0A1H2GC88_9ACTN|nr:hypothetical protein [Jiangella alkaliphila]SDU17175.1 hypothetical protein SAMN04488563_0416 [Jiangella alkaliphila]